MHNLMTVMLTAWGYKLTYLEFLAFITSVVGVWYGIYGPRITWPWWNISSLLYALLFFQQKYYASAALQFVFIAGGFWGWFGWGAKGAKPHKLTWKINLAMIGIYLIAWFAINPLLTHIGAAATWTDSFGFVGSCIAQGLMCMEKFEAWPLWFVVDAVYTFQFWHGGSYLTSLLYFIFVLLAIGGWKRWNRVSNLNKIAMK